MVLAPFGRERWPVIRSRMAPRTSRVAAMSMCGMLKPKCRSNSESSAAMMAWRSFGEIAS
jgi:hypothetical protein